MKNEIETINKTIFESIKHIDEDGFEFWYASELMKGLDYHKWDKFQNVIKKCMTSCKKSKIDTNVQFLRVGKLSSMSNNEFRINLTKEALTNKKIDNESDANNEHYNIGKSVREVIIKSGGILPENYPKPDKSVKKIENKKNRKLSP